MSNNIQKGQETFPSNLLEIHDQVNRLYVALHQEAVAAQQLIKEQTKTITELTKQIKDWTTKDIEQTKIIEELNKALSSEQEEKEA